MLELLLAHADDNAPVLGEGVPLDVAGEGLKNERFWGLPIQCFCGLSRDPADLEAQGWGVIAPEGARGDRLLALIDPLVKVREEQQGEKAPTFRLPSGMRAEDVLRWRRDVFEARPAEESARYLLLLGDLDEISLDVQQQMSTNAFVGRLAFSSDQDYESYVAKVLKWEKAPVYEQPPEALFYVVRDGTAATTIGYNALMKATLQGLRQRKEEGVLALRDVAAIGSDGEDPRTFLERVSAPHPTMLLSISHGLGAPRGGWRSLDEQHALQGAMSLGAGERIAGEDIRNGPFLPGGFWFLLAGYGGGTPSESVYHHWLDRLHQAGKLRGAPGAVLAGLPKSGERPFVAALPKAALANPDGPLAVIAPMDVAWTCGVQRIGDAVQRPLTHLQEIFRMLGSAGRAGMAHLELSHVASVAEADLAVHCDEEDAARARGSPIEETPARLATKAYLWMLRQSVRSCVTLGDPTVRIPGARKVKRKRR